MTTSEPQAECCNEECGWKGAVADCVHFHNDPHQTPFCPECQEVVEIERAADSASGDGA